MLKAPAGLDIGAVTPTEIAESILAEIIQLHRSEKWPVAMAVLLGDQPGVEAAVIDMVVEAWRREPTPIACAAYRGRPGHLFILARAVFPLREALRGDRAGWKIVDAHPDWLRPVPIDRPSPGDVNTWEAYQALRAQ